MSFRKKDCNYFTLVLDSLGLGSKSTQKEVSRAHIGIRESVLKLKLILFMRLFFYF